MLQKFFRFFISLIVFSLLLLVAWEFLLVYLPQKFQFTGFKYILLFYVVLTAVFHLGALYFNEKGNAGFMRYYVAATTFKLLMLMSIMIIYAIMNPGIAVHFILYFFLCYLIYTAFETIVIFKFLKP